MEDFIMNQKLKKDYQLGHQLRKLRKEKGLTQDQICIKLQLQGIDISRSMYSQMECGTYNIPVSVLRAFVDIVGTDYNTILALPSQDT